MTQENHSNEVLCGALMSLDLDAVQSCDGVQVLPLRSNLTSAMSYLTLSEAMGVHQLTVTEIDANGSVPELRVENQSTKPVLLLDGEELAGAKQNRVLNTTILLKKMSKTTIPVSCTEQGRWAYTEASSPASDVIMHRTARAKNKRAVAFSLEAEGRYASDQEAVWASVEQLHESLGSESPTRAMRDAYVSVHDRLSNLSAGFPLIDRQMGLLVLFHGKPVGFDMLSRPDAYARLHTKLLQSYLMDAVTCRPDGEHNDVDHDTLRRDAQWFLKRAMQTTEARFKSVGHGWDCRYSGNGIVGSTLEYRHQLLHCAFFAESDARGRKPAMPDMNRRRHFRSDHQTRDNN